MIRLLVCDDSAVNREAVRAVLADDPEIAVVGEAADGLEAVALTGELAPDVVLLDLKMPVLDGVEAAREIRRQSPAVRIVAFTAHDEPELVVAMIEAGASGYCLKGAPLEELRRAITAAGGAGLGYVDERTVPRLFAEVVRLYHDERRVVARLAEANRELAASAGSLAELARGVVRALATAVEARDGSTGSHIDRVSRYALLLSERVAPELVRDPRIEFGYLLHDVGKLGVPDTVLRKAGPLEDDELAQMRAHVEIGDRLLEPIPGFEPVRAIVHFHHERWDGSGYPTGARGEEIPLAARLFAVCDAYDAMTSERPYRAAMPEAHALAELERGSGSQFDPEAVRELVAFARASPAGKPTLLEIGVLEGQ